MKTQEWQLKLNLGEILATGNWQNMLVFQTFIFYWLFKTLVQICAECFQTGRNRTLNRHIIVSRKQKPNETLHQFWNVLNGLAARGDMGNQTEGFIHNLFVLNLLHKQVKVKLCTGPKETPTQSSQCAIAFEDGLKRPKSYGYINQEPRMKEEPACSMSTTSSNTNECWWWGGQLYAWPSKKMQSSGCCVQLLWKKGQSEESVQSKEIGHWTEKWKMERIRQENTPRGSGRLWR